jgi:hypothetical protein
MATIHIKPFVADITIVGLNENRKKLAFALKATDSPLHGVLA